MRKETWAALLIVAVAAACGGDRSAQWEGSVTDSAGVAIVQNTATGLWGPDEGWRLTEELRIGTAEGEPEYQFGQIQPASSIAIASDGRIVVLDAQGRHIKVFGPDGKYLKTIGGPGGGPGEIGAGASAVLMAPGDTIVLSDIGNQRMNLYQLDGTFVRSTALNFAEGIPFRWESTSDGRIIAQFRRLAFPGSTQAPDSMDALVAWQLDGSLGDTLMRVPSGKTLSFAGGAPQVTVFSPEPSWALLGDRVLYGVSDRYRVGVYGAGGQLERIVEKPFELSPVTEDDQQTYRDLIGETASAQGAPPQAIQQFLSTLKFEEQYPAFAQLLGGVDGTIWVQRFRTPSSLTEEERKGFNPQYDLLAPDWDVFDSEGRFLGVVRMPPRFQPVRFLGTDIYGIQRDELDVQYVVKLAIEKPDAT
jgi:hypothetical protein